MKWAILSAGIANLVFAYIIFRRAPQTHFKFYFLFFIFTAAGWIFSNFALINFLSLFWLRTTYALGALVVATALVWVISFNDEQKPVSRTFLFVCYGIGFAFFISCYVNNLFLKDMELKAVVAQGVYGPFFPVYSVFTTGIMLFLLFRILQYMLIFKGAKRIQARYIFWGLLGYIIVTTVVSLILPLFGYPQFGFLDSPSSLLFIGFTTYAITKHHLMDISVIISRAVAWVLTVIFLGSVYFGLVWLHLTYLSPQIGGLFLAWTILYGILVGETFQRIRLFIQTTSDKVFLHGKYDYYKELSDATTQIIKKLSMENILNSLRRTFFDTIEVSNPRIYLPEDFMKPEIQDFLSIQELTFRDDNLIIPCLLEDRLIALIVLGKKLSEDPYTDEDLRLLKTLANQTAVAIDHTRTYEEVKKDFEANQHKLFEAERQLTRAQRLSSLGRIVSEVAHEIRNPLTVVMSKAREIKNTQGIPEAIRDSTDLILERADRIEKVVGTMRTLSQPPHYEPQEVAISEPIESALRFMPFKREIKIKKEYNQVPPVIGDKNELERVFINLFTNAYDAMAEKGGELSIRLQRENGWVRVEIEDTGVGISKEDLPKIFEPFFTTKFGKIEDRMGFGLSIVHNIIVEKHKGTVTTQSEPGKGTKFIITLPAKI